MKHASLFSGIGGFDLASEWMGWTNLFTCEVDAFCRTVLAHHFPNAIPYADIKTLDATAHIGRVDILTGGFPCQPYSNAGKRRGKHDPRDLWPEMLRVIRECAPRWVVGENVLGLLTWSDGLRFEEVCASLEAEGYEVQPFVLPASGVGAPHRRPRVWIVAHAPSRTGGRATGEVQGTPRSSDGDGKEQPKRSSGKQVHVPLESTLVQRDLPRSEAWKAFPTFAPICGGDDGLPERLDGITVSKWKREAVKAYGNAIVPQVAFEIFQAIQAYEDGARV